MKKFVFVSAALVLLVLISFIAGAQESAGLNGQFKSTSVSFILYSSIIISLLIIISMFNKKNEKTKIFLFLSIAVISFIVTSYLVVSTIYLDSISETNGPVHWHADFEIWNCGGRIEFIDPSGLTNRIGDPILHEHGDNRIHVEGVLVKKSDADLDSFFESIGGSIEEDYLIVPTNAGLIKIGNGYSCNNLTGVLQAFVYKSSGSLYHQEKIEDFENYILSPYSNIPPGDCIILEFSEEKEKTDKICESYRIAIEKGEIKESGS